jgi:hypothetical protein
MTTADRQSIEHFVRGTLGCKCPDEVFESITILRAPTPTAATPHTRLLIGERLLIDVFETHTVKDTAAAVTALARQGLLERDAKQYNRYRLVIASDYPTELLSAARTGFDSVVGTDHRAHLHILATDQLPDALRSGDMNLSR